MKVCLQNPLSVGRRVGEALGSGLGPVGRGVGAVGGVGVAVDGFPVGGEGIRTEGAVVGELVG